MLPCALAEALGCLASNHGVGMGERLKISFPVTAHEARRSYSFVLWKFELTLKIFHIERLPTNKMSDSSVVFLLVVKAHDEGKYLWSVE